MTFPAFEIDILAAYSSLKQRTLSTCA